jgi:hypothetical protein
MPPEQPSGGNYFLPNKTLYTLYKNRYVFLTRYYLTNPLEHYIIDLLNIKTTIYSVLSFRGLNYGNSNQKKRRKDNAFQY